MIVNGAFAQDSRDWEKKLEPVTDEAAIRKQYSTIIAMNARGRAIVAEMQRVGSLGFTFRQPVTREEVEKVRSDRKAYTTALDKELQLLEKMITGSVPRDRAKPTDKKARPSKNSRQIDNGQSYLRALDERAGLLLISESKNTTTGNALCRCTYPTKNTTLKPGMS